jgi:hypothetical protein
MADMTMTEQNALRRLLQHANRDTGQARRVADFLLAWWNPDACGRFDMRDAWGCDDAIVEDIVTLFGYIARNNRYPDTLGPQYVREYSDLLANWRPDLLKAENQA